MAGWRAVQGPLGRWCGRFGYGRTWISISLNPVAFASAPRIARWIGARPKLLGQLERDGARSAESVPGPVLAELRDHVVIVGFGRVGSAVGEALARRSIPYAVVEQDREKAEALREQGHPMIHGDATRPGVLGQARLEHARLLVVAAPDPYQVRTIIENARSAKSTIETVARTHSENEREYLEKHGVGLALVGERELALSLAHHALMRMGCNDDEADATVSEVRSPTTRLRPR